MTQPLAEAALAAVAARLREAFPGIPVRVDDRDDAELRGDAPAFSLSVFVGELAADLTRSPGETVYEIPVEIVGYCKPDDAEKALAAAALASAGDTFSAAADHALGRKLRRHAAEVVAALSLWRPDAYWASDMREDTTTFRAFDSHESALAAGEFSVRYVMDAGTPTANPFV